MVKLPVGLSSNVNLREMQIRDVFDWGPPSHISRISAAPTTDRPGGRSRLDRGQIFTFGATVLSFTDTTCENRSSDARAGSTHTSRRSQPPKAPALVFACVNLETSQLHPNPLISALWSGERALPCPCSDSPSLRPTPVIACAELSIGASRIDSYGNGFDSRLVVKHMGMTKIGSRRLSPSLSPDSTHPP